MDIGAVLFDCDGVLVDSEVLANEVLVACVRELGFEITPEEAHHRFTGHRIAVCVADLERDLGRPVPPTFVADARARMDAAFASRLRRVEGALDLVRSVTVPYCTASGGPRTKIERSLSLTGLLPYFEGRIFSSYDVGSWKPDPGLFLHAAAAIAVAPERCVVIEDSRPGVLAGLAAGMHVVAYQPVPARAIPDLPREVTVVTRLADVAQMLRPAR